MSDTPRTAALIEHARTMAEVLDSHEQMEHELAAVTAERDALLKVLSQIEEGCSFPSDPVQRAIRDVARASIAASKEKP